jgi:hypothetical protein
MSKFTGFDPDDYDSLVRKGYEDKKSNYSIALELSTYIEGIIDMLPQKSEKLNNVRLWMLKFALDSDLKEDWYKCSEEKESCLEELNRLKSQSAPQEPKVIYMKWSLFKGWHQYEP